jgi:hypothetical protein
MGGLGSLVGVQNLKILNCAQTAAYEEAQILPSHFQSRQILIA